ncbi:uncharacterized protein METZ01_LOCUS233538 [marine metagenome]|uniref:Uncharacterized protein n=1 Tax=marine metagenome TaxID=408172 RepID=A0A382H0E3_9ZZZZ
MLDQTVHSPIAIVWKTGYAVILISTQAYCWHRYQRT